MVRTVTTYDFFIYGAIYLGIGTLYAVLDYLWNMTRKAGEVADTIESAKTAAINKQENIRAAILLEREAEIESLAARKKDVERAEEILRNMGGPLTVQEEETLLILEMKTENTWQEAALMTALQERKAISKKIVDEKERFVRIENPFDADALITPPKLEVLDIMGENRAKLLAVPKWHAGVAAVKAMCWPYFSTHMFLRDAYHVVRCAMHYIGQIVWKWALRRAGVAV